MPCSLAEEITPCDAPPHIGRITSIPAAASASVISAPFDPSYQFPTILNSHVVPLYASAAPFA